MVAMEWSSSIMAILCMDLLTFPEAFDFLHTLCLDIIHRLCYIWQSTLVDQTVPFAHFYYVAHMVRFLF